ncbi:MAG: hypothetical protein AMXMBFR76_21980 [Pseudomonadota bacterium]
MKQKLIAIACLPVLLAACSFIPKSPGADRVLLLPLERVKSCTEVGQTKVQVLDRVGFLARRGASVDQDLQRVARNNAVDMGGDTISALTGVVNGRQTFGVYKCL